MIKIKKRMRRILRQIDETRGVWLTTIVPPQGENLLVAFQNPSSREVEVNWEAKPKNQTTPMKPESIVENGHSKTEFIFLYGGSYLVQGLAKYNTDISRKNQTELNAAASRLNDIQASKDKIDITTQKRLLSYIGSMGDIRFLDVVSDFTVNSSVKRHAKKTLKKILYRNFYEPFTITSIDTDTSEFRNKAMIYALENESRYMTESIFKELDAYPEKYDARTWDSVARWGLKGAQASVQELHLRFARFCELTIRKNKAEFLTQFKEVMNASKNQYVLRYAEKCVDNFEEVKLTGAP